MWWAGSDVIEMYLGTFSGGWAIDGRTQAWAAHADPASGLASWAEVIERERAGRWRKAKVTLWLSGGLARPFLCGPVAGLAGWNEAEAMASAAAPDATGFDVPCRVRLEGWPGDASVLGTAVDAAVLEAIDEIARTRRLAWRSVCPRWAGLLDEARARHASVSLVACAEEDALTILGGATSTQDTAEGQFDLAATYAPAPAADRLAALWNRTMLSRDVRTDDTWFARVKVPDLGLDQSVDDERSQRFWPDAVGQLESAFP